MNNDLISREALKKEIENLIGYSLSYEAILNAIDNAPTVELDEGVIQEVLKKRCMTVITNEYLIELITSNGKRPQGEWLKNANQIYKCSLCGAYGNPNYFRFCPNCGAKMKGGAE